MTVAELHIIAQLVARLMEEIEAAENKAKSWKLIAESLMGVSHID